MIESLLLNLRLIVTERSFSFSPGNQVLVVLLIVHPSVFIYHRFKVPSLIILFPILLNRDLRFHV